MLLTLILEFLVLPWASAEPVFTAALVLEGEEEAAGRGLALGLQFFLKLLKPRSSASAVPSVPSLYYSHASSNMSSPNLPMSCF